MIFVILGALIIGLGNGMTKRGVGATMNVVGGVLLLFGVWGMFFD